MEHSAERFSESEISSVVTPALSRVDLLRAQGLEGLEAALQARHTALNLERSRLAEKLGDSHLRVLALTQRIDAGQAEMRRVRMEVARAKTAPPESDPQSWLFHGFVWQRDGSPAPGLTVELADEHGRPVEALGSAFTDPHGYFNLRARLDRPGQTAGAQHPMEERRLFIRVVDRSKMVLYVGKEGLTVTRGRVVYCEITLDQDEDGGAAAGVESPVRPRDSGDEGRGSPPRRRPRKRDGS